MRDTDRLQQQLTGSTGSSSLLAAEASARSAQRAGYIVGARGVRQGDPYAMQILATDIDDAERAAARWFPEEQNVVSAQAEIDG